MLRFSDSCDTYAIIADVQKKWALVDSSFTISTTGGRFGGGCIINGGGVAGRLISSRLNVMNTNAGVVGFYFKASANPASPSPFWQAVGPVNSPIVSQLNLLASGQIQVYGFNVTLTSGFTSINTVTDNNWHWIEYQFGALSTLYIDGIANGSQTFTNDNVTNSVIRSQHQLVAVAGIAISFDDIYIYDSATPLPTTSSYPIGPRQITVTRPVSDNTIGFATASAGTTHFNLVNENVPDGDTTYVQDSTAGNQDLLNMGALPYTPANITGVMTNLYVDNPNAGTINIEAICKSGTAAVAPATAQQTPLIYQTLQFPFSVDPNTGVAWVPAALNAAQFGYKNA
jgi:hypothetical protein